MDIVRHILLVPSFINEIIHIHSPNLVSRDNRRSNAEIDHKLSELLAIYKNYLRINLAGIFSCLTRKGRGGNKYALPGPLSLQCACKFLDLQAAYNILPAFSLYVYGIEAEAVFFNYAIYAISVDTPKQFLNQLKQELREEHH